MCATLARWMRNLLGTQPVFRHVLPQGSRYTRATLAPASTARLAASAPASPAPITIASVSTVDGIWIPYVVHVPRRQVERRPTVGCSRAPVHMQLARKCQAIQV